MEQNIYRLGQGSICIGCPAKTISAGITVLGYLSLDDALRFNSRLPKKNVGCGSVWGKIPTTKCVRVDNKAKPIIKIQGDRHITSKFFILSHECD